MGCQSLGARAAQDRGGRDRNNVSQGTQQWERGLTSTESANWGDQRQRRLGWTGGSWISLFCPHHRFPEYKAGIKELCTELLPYAPLNHQLLHHPCRSWGKGSWRDQSPRHRAGEQVCIREPLYIISLRQIFQGIVFISRKTDCGGPSKA